MRHGRCGNPSALLTILGMVVLIAAGAGPVLASEILAPGTAGADTVSAPVLAAASDAIGADPVAGDAPLSVRFTDTAPARWMSEPMYWEWSFGDGYISLDRNPAHVYRAAGTYTVNMTITYWGRPSVTDTYSTYYRVTYIATGLVTVRTTVPPIAVPTLAGTTHVVCGDPAIQDRPRVDAGIVVWQDYRDSDRAYRADVYAYDIANGTTRRLTGLPSAQDPAVSGPLVAWTDYAMIDAWGNPMMIQGHDLPTDTEDPIVAFDQTWDPAVDGTSMAFAGKLLNEDGYPSARRVYLVEDVGTGAVEQITPVADYAGAPDISADWVVYQMSVNGSSDSDIYAMDRRTWTTRLVCGAPGNQVGPRVWQDRVVWADYRDAIYLPNGGQDRRTSDVYYYNLTTGTGRRLTDGTSLCLDPAISGDLVVWTDLRNQNYDIYAYDLRTGQEQAVTAEVSAETMPDVDGNHVVYRDGANGGDIRLRVLEGYGGPPPVLALPGGAPPTDPDSDGLYDDVNGNGRPDFADVVLYFNQMGWIAGNEPVGLFDYNGNGRIDFADVVWLFNNL